MSEERQLNEVEALLRQLAPVPLNVNRDALFFAAGMAAADRRRAGRLVWPALAAGLLLACGGLAVALQKKSSALDAALAASAPGQVAERSVADDRPSAPRQPTPQQSGGVLVVNDSPAGGANRRAGFGSQRDMDELFWREPSRGSRLTALGWVDGPAIVPGQDEQRTAPAEPLRQIRRGDSLELLRALGG